MSVTSEQFPLHLSETETAVVRIALAFFIRNDPGRWLEPAQAVLRRLSEDSS